MGDWLVFLLVFGAVVGLFKAAVARHFWQTWVSATLGLWVLGFVIWLVVGLTRLVLAA